MYAKCMNYNMPIQLAIIDHYDSFTYNIVSWLKDSGFALQVFKYDEPQLLEKIDPFSAILYSPGPGHPADYSQTHQIITHFMGKKPQIGICLGMQFFLLLKGNSIVRTGPVHGKVALIRHTKEGIFDQISSPTAVARYHSLGSMESKGFKRTAEVNSITMGIQNDTDKLIGVQFHPESFLTHHAQKMAANLLKWVKSNE